MLRTLLTHSLPEGLGFRASEHEGLGVNVWPGIVGVKQEALRGRQRFQVSVGTQSKRCRTISGNPKETALEVSMNWRAQIQTPNPKS